MPTRPSAYSQRLRVSVRSLMILVLVLAIGPGWVIHNAHVQRDAVAAIEGAGGYVSYDRDWKDGRFRTSKRPRYLQWLADRVGIDCLSNVVLVSLAGNISDEKLAIVGQFPRLEELDFVATRPTIEGHGHRLPLSRTSVSDAGLAHVDGLTRLKELDISCTLITDGGLLHLIGMTRLQDLDLSGTDVSDAGLVHLARMTSLQHLDLHETKVTNAGLVHLKGLKSLRSLDLFGTEVDDFGAQELRRALPNVMIYYHQIWAQ